MTVDVDARLSDLRRAPHWAVAERATILARVLTADPTPHGNGLLLIALAVGHWGGSRMHRAAVAVGGAVLRCRPAEEQDATFGRAVAAALLVIGWTVLRASPW